MLGILKVKMSLEYPTFETAFESGLVSTVGIAELHAVKLGLTKDGMPCHQQKTLKPSAKAIATTTQCKTPAKARVTNVLDENGPHLLSFVV